MILNELIVTEYLFGLFDDCFEIFIANSSLFFQKLFEQRNLDNTFLEE